MGVSGCKDQLQNIMANNLIIQKAIEEIETRSFGVTEQFLQVHEVVYVDGKPHIARVDTEKNDGTAIVYFPVVDEQFYLAIYLDTVQQVTVNGVGTEPYNCVYFRASSETLSFEQLSLLTVLKPTGGRNKGDKKWSGETDVLWKETTIFFETNPEADEFEDKLRKLLEYLETDTSGVAELVEKAGGYIQVAIEFHNGNTMLGGPHIDHDSIKRMADLNLYIAFDLYAGGNYFRA